MKIGKLEIHPGKQLFFIAGPCVIESEEGVLEIAGDLADFARKNGVALIFKASFDKANRSAVDSFRGPGVEKGLEILARVRAATGLPVTSDIHECCQAQSAGEILDLVQIPAFLCRQTDLIAAAAKTGKPINLKKGQFIAPWDMQNAVDKAAAGGAREILLTERGSFFGYNNLVVDMRSFHHLKKTGCPVLFDATHSVQKPGGLGKTTGGDREMAPILAKAAVAAGCDGLFFEVHPRPEEAKSDGPNMLTLTEFKNLIPRLVRIYEAGA